VRNWIASATPERDLLPILRQRGLTRFLRGALGGPASKVANLRRIMRAENAGAHNLLFVGDGPDDLAAAKTLRLRFVAITAEGRIPGRGEFAMRDVTGLVPLIDRIDPRPSLRMRRAMA